jgi:serine/threonine-protein phosphatase 6 catalytic subunit
MGKGLDLDAWIAKVRARAGAAPPRRRASTPNASPVARVFSPRRVADLRRSRRGTASAPPHSRPRGRASAARVSASSPFSRFLGRRASLTSARPDRASFVAALRRKNQKNQTDISQIKRCEPLEERELESLCGYVKEVLVEESNVQPVCSPVTVCGDIHGQFHDLLKLLETGGDVPDTNYIFMGDFVDRGYNSLESFTLLLLLKARWPQCVTLLRGNHESRQITQVYGFYDECQRKYGNANAWRWCTDVFDYLTLSALIDGKTLCVHGGLSPDVRSLDQIRTIDRLCEIPHEGPFCDMMWSDPEDIETWAVSPRGAGWLFGRRVTSEFNEINGLELICRAHQLVQEGLKYMFPEKSLVTVWSAPNYCYRCGNVASVLAFDESGERTVKYFTETPENSTMMAPRASVPYFL